MKDGGANTVADGIGEGRHRGVAQNQNRRFQSRPPELHSLQHRADAEESAFILQEPGHLDGPVAVGIGLDDAHHRQTGLFFDGSDIFFNGIQVNDHLGIVVIQAYQLISVDSSPF